MDGASDAWERLWTPHRMAYLRGENKPTHDGAGADCPFCVAPDLDAESTLVAARGDLAYVVLNLYPYNSGHLLVCPYRHVADYADLTVEEVAEIGALTQRAMTVLRQVAGCHGFNIGLNQGSVAGAGIAAHLHQHVVPRWGGDNNFMPVIGGTKVLSSLLESTRDLIAQAWSEHSSDQ